MVQGGCGCWCGWVLVYCWVVCPWGGWGGVGFMGPGLWAWQQAAGRGQAAKRGRFARVNTRDLKVRLVSLFPPGIFGRSGLLRSLPALPLALPCALPLNPWGVMLFCPASGCTSPRCGPFCSPGEGVDKMARAARHLVHPSPRRAARVPTLPRFLASLSSPPARPLRGPPGHTTPRFATVNCS